MLLLLFITILVILIGLLVVSLLVVGKQVRKWCFRTVTSPLYSYKIKRLKSVQSVSPNFCKRSSATRMLGVRAENWGNL